MQRYFQKLTKTEFWPYLWMSWEIQCWFTCRSVDPAAIAHRTLGVQLKVNVGVFVQ